MINLEPLVSTYGYPALLVGTFLEGETILVIAGFLAHRGYLELPGVIVAAFLGTFSGDQIYFWLGWTKGANFLMRRPSYRVRVEKAQNLREKYQKRMHHLKVSFCLPTLHSNTFCPWSG